ncbi:flavin-containing monooxygenase, partial [Kitasatospora sp. NPDC057936]
MTTTTPRPTTTSDDGPPPTPTPAQATTDPTTDTTAAPAAGAGPVLRHLKVAVIGTGFSGLGTAIRLLQTGTDDFLVFERADDLGGTWRDNTYPGCACDVQAHLYSFSFARNPHWKSTFATQTEVHDYLRDCAHKHGVLPYLRYNHELLTAHWNDTHHHWDLNTTGGRYTTQFLITGTGYLSTPAIPDIPGIHTFTGTLFHSAQWNHHHNLTGRTIAVIGTGASAIQFLPHIQPQAARLDLYQRTPPWIA